MSIFRFKQFEVDQTGCAMKVNTDGVLLGALTESSNPQRILDIGTGTGVIALMLAQRFPQAFVDAVEIDELAAKTAILNAEKSIFADRVRVKHSAYQDFEPNRSYDLIVSNPPFFVNDLRSDEHRKGLARHADTDFFEMMVEKSARLLNKNGQFWLVLPLKQADQVIALAAEFGLSLCHRINLHSDKTKPAFRQVIGLSEESLPLIERNFYIYESLNQNTEAYKLLLKDFFLAF